MNTNTNETTDQTATKQEQKRNNKNKNSFVGWICCFLVIIVLTSWIVQGFWSFIIAAVVCFFATFFVAGFFHFDPEKSKFGSIALCATFLFVAYGACSDSNGGNDSASKGGYETYEAKEISCNLIGVWINTSDNSNKFEFNSNGTFTMYCKFYDGRILKDSGTWNRQGNSIRLRFYDSDMGTSEMDIIDANTIRDVSYTYHKR